MSRIKYKSGYKHQLIREYSIKTKIKPIKKIETDYIVLNIDGYLTIKKGYAWDGASSIPDTKRVIRASLVHDAFYQLMRTKSEIFHRNDYRKPADILFKEMCVEDGMRRSLAKRLYFGLRAFGGKFAGRESKKEVKTAP